MPSKRIGEIIKNLQFEKKLLLVGGVLVAVSVFLPWYSDLDAFKAGDVFLGITGPQYLAGFSILALSLISLVLLAADIKGTKIKHLPFKNSSFQMFAGVAVFYLLIVINAVYFHPKFGFNITLKESLFGMFMAFIGASLTTIGGYLSSRDKVAILKNFTEQAGEPVIGLEGNDLRKPKENLRVVEQVRMMKSIDEKLETIIKN
jgi:hypothetical protein